MEEESEISLDRGRSMSARESLTANYRQIVYRQANETIKHLRDLAEFLRGNIFIHDTIKLGSFKKKSSTQSLQKKPQQTTDEKINLQQFFQQAGTNSLELIDSLEQISQKISYFLTEQVEDRPQSAQSRYENKILRRSFSAVSDQDEQTRGEFIAQIFNFINQSYFPNPVAEKVMEKNKKRLAINILEIQTKLSTIPVFVGSIIGMKADITTHRSFDPTYEYVWKHIHLVEAGDKSLTKRERLRLKAKEDYQKLKLMMKVTTAAVVTEFMTSELELVRKLVFGLSFPRFFFDEIEAQLRCYRIWRCPKVNNLNSVWNLSQRGALKHLKNLIFPKIKTKMIIYLPPLCERQIQDMVKSSSKQANSNLSNVPENFNIFQKQNLSEKYEILILNSKKLELASNYQSYQNCYCCPCFQKSLPFDYQTIIIHIHGGGFIALSSQTTQSYTRKWANQLQIPVFSINYRKPPQNRFPIPLYDCLAGYLFIVQRIKYYFNVNPKQIILAGDSAGGNLALSLMGLLLKLNYPIRPIGMLLAYPAADLRERYSPSRLNSFNDAILLPTLLLLCLKQYLGENTLLQFEPLASPLLLTEQYVNSRHLFSYLHSGKLLESFKEKDRRFPKRWPKTVLMVGKQDPLYDDTLRLMERLVSSGVDAQMLLYRDFSHAFLSLDGVIPACIEALQDSVNKLREMIKAPP